MLATVGIAHVRTWSVASKFMLVLAAVFLVKQAINVFIFPAFSGHDEVVHYAYVQTVAQEHRVPEIVDLEEFRASYQNGSIDQFDWIPDSLYPYCRYVLDWLWCDQPRWAADPPHIVTVQGNLYPWGWQYAANHPPLYYLLMTPIALATDDFSPETQLYAMRAAAIPFGLAIVLLSFAMVRTIFPNDQFLSITVPAFVAFQPQISYEAAMVNNDIMGIFIFSLALYLVVSGLKRGFSYRLVVGIGAVVGIGLLLKRTALTTIPIIELGMIYGIGIRNVREWATKGAIAGAIAGLFAWPWYLFLYRTYGNFSGLDQIAANQWGWTYPEWDRPSIFDLLWNRDFAVFRWRETWGLFGWRLINLGDGMLWAIGVPCIVATIGLLIYLIAIGVSWRPSIQSGGFEGVAALQSYQVQSIAIIAVAALVSYGAMLQFGTRFRLTQARYFFPAINAFAFLLMLGMRTVLPESWRRYGQGGVAGGLILLNVLIYTQYVIPYWYLGS